MRGRNWVRFTVVLLAATLVATGAMAQVTTGRLIGTVVDNEGVALPGVTVRVNSDTLLGGQRATVSDTKGEFSFISLPVGVYTVDAALDGYVSQQWSEVRMIIASSNRRARFISPTNRPMSRSTLARLRV